MEGELKKMLIEAYREADYSGSVADSFEVMFNPNTYSQKYEVEYQDRQGQGDSGSPQIFGKIKPQEYTFEFLFDGTGAAAEPVDVQETVDHFLTVTGKHDGEIHRPMYLKLSWGSLISKCVLKSAEMTYTLFKPDGYPLRAKVKATFAENVEDALRVAEERKSSPDLTHVHTVKEGEHLSLLANRYYGDPSRYFQVARFNRLKNYRRLDVGRKLAFPPIRDLPQKTQSS
jgi:LysM repeat protein